MSNRSITTSIIQSQLPIFEISSSKFPMVILWANDLRYSGAGLEAIAVCNELFTIRFLTAGDSRLNPFFVSSGDNSRGTMSRRSTSHPMFAK